ncbi:hypothetical protein Cgig2_012346 [Carnegiea gigantea]|uniref:Uncharacterized protein n=1 Tax=Carnegiea gigantea TaxID=171969 RepID=A0A9Q1JL35_9CARY|nr:hypothetical protein Cgig2_012346 [Carnegiea gigantea]
MEGFFQRLWGNKGYERTVAKLDGVFIVRFHLEVAFMDECEQKESIEEEEVHIQSTSDVIHVGHIECVTPPMGITLQNSFAKVRSVGPVFTWSNKHGVVKVCSKLDKVLMNEEALLAVSEVLYEVLPKDVSDHNPLQLTFGNQHKLRHLRFICFNIHYINSIKAMRKENGELTYSKDEIGGILVQHLQNFLGVRATRTRQKTEMLKLVNEDEFKIAMFSICNNKCPGSDGYGSGFFKESWNVIRHDVIQVVQEFFTTGKLLK